MSGHRKVAVATAALLSAVLVVGCSSGSSSRPRLSGSAPVRPTNSANAPESAPATSAKPEKTTKPPIRESSAAAATTAGSGAQNSEPAPASASAATAEDSDSSSTTWVWILVAIVAIGAVGWLIWLLLRNSRRRKWDERYTGDLAEARWVSTALADSVASPTLSTDSVTLYWNESRPRLDQLKSELVALGIAAPDQERRAKAARVSEGVDGLVESMQSHVGLRGAMPSAPGGDVTLSQSRSVVENRRRTLQDAIEERPITTPPATPGPGPGGPTGSPPPPPPPGWSG